MVEVRREILSDCRLEKSLTQRVSIAWKLADSHQFHEAVTLLEDSLDGECSGQFIQEYARFLHTFASPQKALNLISPFLEQRAASPSPRMLNEAATYAREAGHYVLAKQYQQQAIKYELASSSHGVLCRQTLLGQAFDLLNDQEFSSAKFLLSSLCEGDGIVAKTAKLALSEQYLREKELDAARTILQELVRSCDPKDESKLIAKSLKVIGCVEIQDSKYKKAETYLNQALELTQDSARCHQEKVASEDAITQLKSMMKVLCQNPALN